MKQAENIARIEGILSEIDLTESKDSNGKDRIMGEVKVKTVEEIDGKNYDIEIPISLYATKTTNSGAPNPAYEGIKRIKDEYVSLAACGDENIADRVRFDNCTIVANEFYGQGDVLISYPRVRGSFCKKVRKEDYEQAATFSAVIVIAKITEETNKEGVETGNLIVTGILSQYGDKVDIIEYKVVTPAAINHINNNWKVQDTVRIAGKIKFTNEVKHITTEMGFGEPIVNSKTIFTRDLIITAGSDGALDDGAYEVEDVKAALKERQDNLAKLKEASKKKGTKTVNTSKNSNSFGF